MKLTGKTILLVALVPLSLPAVSQQGNIWYFGDHAGVDFNSGNPVALTDGQINTNEGCASIADHNGQLLFYTDGIKIWNKNHQQMPNGNGLHGDPSSSNSAIVIPRPGSNTIFYVFTADAGENGNAKGYCYSEIDMTLNGGLGDVTAKNVLLYAPSSEKLTAVRHSNGIDVWVITHAWGNNQWRVFRVDCNGVSLVPVNSNAGFAYTRTVTRTDGFLLHEGSVGCLKADAKGEKLATTMIADNLWEIFDFDKTTGIISNPISIPATLAFGVEFSPNSKYVYISRQDTLLNGIYGDILQYDLSVYNAAAIAASRVSIGVTEPFSHMGALQLGPDNKIYSNVHYKNYLGVINFPDNPGLSCSFTNNAVDLVSGIGLRGLPVFFPSLITNQNVSFNFTTANDCATVNFSGTSSITGIVNWQWDFGDGNTATGQNVSHTYATGGATLYKVKLTVSFTNVCPGILTAEALTEIDLHRTVPVSQFDFTTACGSPGVAFKDLSTITGSSIQSWLWDFGDGLSSTDQNPVHIYAAYGDYTVTLTTTSSGSCNGSSIASKTVTIADKPVSGFTNTKTCENQSVSFTDNSTIGSGVIDHWYWDFGDGNVSTDQNPLYVYAKAGDYVLKMAAVSSAGCSGDTISKMISVSSVPTVAFSVSDTCLGQPSVFNGTVSVTNGTISSWWWDLGDGATNTQSSFQHGYSTAGSFVVRVSVVAGSGCTSDTSARNIRVGSKPAVAFMAPATCGNKQVIFTDQSTGTGQPVSAWYWDFGDGAVSNDQSPIHSYTSFGDYTVRHTAISELGCIGDTISQLHAVKAKPVAGFNSTNGCVDQQVQFSDGSTIEQGSITRRHWILNDGVSSAAGTPNYIYHDAGDYIVQLVVESDKNCISDTVSKIIRVETKPVAAFSVAGGCAGKDLAINNNSSIAFGRINSYFWNFQDGTTATGPAPAFSYNRFGDYNIKLTAASENGCLSDTVIQQVHIESIPEVNFDFDAVCVGKPARFTSAVQNESGAIVKWLWDFGDGGQSGEPDPSYTYSRFGNYTISLTAGTQNNCTAMLAKTVSIQKVNVSAGNDTTAAINQPVQLKAQGALTYEWIPASYLNNAFSDNPIAILPSSQTYQLKGTTAEGCVGYDNITIKVYAGPEVYVPTAFTPDNDGLNDVFRPVLAGVKELQYFSVYNRWGQLVFSTRQPGSGWDGSFHNTAQPTGVFAWMLKAVDFRGKIIEKKGTVTLVR